ncbi:hypothetical protein M422DRAFT_28594, partial [Sphaerobolus stellatus SS14]
IPSHPYLKLISPLFLPLPSIRTLIPHTQSALTIETHFKLPTLIPSSRAFECSEDGVLRVNGISAGQSLLQYTP